MTTPAEMTGAWLTATGSTHQQQWTAYARGPEAASISAVSFGETMSVHLPGPEGTRQRTAGEESAHGMPFAQRSSSF